MNTSWRRENIIALGNSSTPARPTSPWLSAWAACQRGFPVAFTTAAGLVHQLMEAKDERRLLRLQAQMTAVKLLIVDELGFTCRFQGLVLSFSSKHSASDMNAVRLSSPLTCRSRNGPVSSPPND